MPLILASSSPFRKKILKKLGLPFSICHPNIDESRLADESAYHLVHRLSQEKVREVAKKNSGIIIASDQVALRDKEILTKPKTYQNAFLQLTQSANKRVKFLTALSVLNTKTKSMQTIVDMSTVHFRKLTKEQISHYLKRDEPYNCAGSLKSEGLGIALLKSIETNDANSLLGLPLIALVEILLSEQVAVL